MLLHTEQPLIPTHSQTVHLAGSYEGKDEAFIGFCGSTSSKVHFI